MSNSILRDCYVVRTDHEIGGELAVRRGEIVEAFTGQDFGIAHADRRRTRVLHICVQRRSGDSGFVSIPFSKLKRL